MVVQAVAQTTALPDHLKQGIIAKGAGNPFFLEELTRSVKYDQPGQQSWGEGE